MLDAALADALARLDARLLAACDEEERRAAVLAGDGRPGWDGVRNLARPSTGALLDPDPPTDRENPDIREKNGALVIGGHPVFDRLREATGLNQVECDLLLVLLATHLEPRYQALYAVLQDDLGQRRATERLLFTVLATTDERRRALVGALGAAGVLIRSGMVRRLPGSFPPLNRPLELADEVADALLGTDPAIPGALGQHRLVANGAARPAPADRAAEPEPTMQILHGTGDALRLARSLLPAGTDLLEVTVVAGDDAPGSCVAAWRAGLCTGVHPVLDLRGWSGEQLEPVVAQLAALVRDVGGKVWLCSRKPSSLNVFQVEAEALGWDGRRRSWLDQAADRNLHLSAEGAGRLASRHRLDATEVAEVFAAADLAAGAGSEQVEAGLTATAQRRHVVEVPLSRRSAPRHTFDDLALTATTRDALDRLVHYARRRDQLTQEQGLGHRYPVDRGPLVLFSGRSGTGKTVAAEAVAHALGRELHTIDISQLLSKYIGETEKHIDDVLTQAERSSGVLLCDEADALFSSRIENAQNSGEHFANVLVGYLLQRIERHDGVVILSTNLRHAIDDAFGRRFQFRVEFPMPSPSERLRIWQLMLVPGVPREPDLDLEGLAESHELSGGDITNAALRAVFLADRDGRPLNQGHLDRAIAVELLEQGRLSRRSAPPTTKLANLAGSGDRGQLLRALTERFDTELREQLRCRFLKEIHLVHGSPTEKALAGRRPAVSLALFRLAARRGTNGVRAGFIASAWSALPEEEYELIGVLHEVLTGIDLKEVAGQPAGLRVQESYDFDLLHKFWSSHDRPVRASVVFDVEIG